MGGRDTVEQLRPLCGELLASRGRWCAGMVGDDRMISRVERVAELLVLAVEFGMLLAQRPQVRTCVEGFGHQQRACLFHQFHRTVGPARADRGSRRLGRESGSQAEAELAVPTQETLRVSRGSSATACSNAVRAASGSSTLISTRP